MEKQLEELLRRQRSGWSMEQACYTDPALFALERKLWFPRQWSVVAHIAELPEVGSRLVRNLFDQEILVVRSSATEVHAFFNVCRHRGSRLCVEDGRSSSIVCPYHAWSYELTGGLRTRRGLPDDVDPSTLGLHPVPVATVDGLVLCGLSAGTLPSLANARQALSPALLFHGVDKAKVAVRKVYPTRANWKLVMENFLECYHCRPAHAEYTSANGHVKVTASTDPRLASQWESEVRSWSASADKAAFTHPIWEPGNIDVLPYGVFRKPIGGKRATLSQDGHPVSTLMGGLAAFDGGESTWRLGRLSFASACNDHVTMFQFNPRAVDMTDVAITWLVDPQTPEDIDLARLTWLWDITTKQDKKIVEENAIGVHSMAYTPGPYTALESHTRWFVQTYVAEMSALVRGESSAKLQPLADMASFCSSDGAL